MQHYLPISSILYQNNNLLPTFLPICFYFLIFYLLLQSTFGYPQQKASRSRAYTSY